MFFCEIELRCRAISFQVGFCSSRGRFDGEGRWGGGGGLRHDRGLGVGLGWLASVVSMCVPSVFRGCSVAVLCVGEEMTRE